MNRPRKTLLFAALVIGVLSAVLIAMRIRHPRPAAPDTPTRDQVRLAVALQPSSALAIIASENGYFGDEGLDVTLSTSVSGKRALAALLVGEVDAATTAQVPIVLAAFEHSNFSTVAAIASLTNVERVVARADRGIAKPADLRAKRVATQRGSAVHFFLHMFLLKNGLSEKDIELSFLKAEELPGALERGTIDAFSMREPYVSQATALLGDRAVVFMEPGIYFRTEHLAVSNHYITLKPGGVHKMIRALLRAEEFARTDPEGAVRIVAAALKVRQSKLASSWPEFRLKVGLDQSILSSMEDQAMWAIGARLTDKSQFPNFLPFIHVECLEAVRPEAITVIH